MAKANHKKLMSVSSEKLWKAILNYESYAQFVDGVQKVKILEKSQGKTKVEYAIELMGKEIFYILEHDESQIPNRMTWKCIESNILKLNEGSWDVRSLGSDQVEVNYELSLEFKIMVPSFMLSGLVKSTLPKMLDSFENQAKK